MERQDCIAAFSALFFKILIKFWKNYPEKLAETHTIERRFPYRN